MTIVVFPNIQLIRFLYVPPVLNGIAPWEGGEFREERELLDRDMYGIRLIEVVVIRCSRGCTAGKLLLSLEHVDVYSCFHATSCRSVCVQLCLGTIPIIRVPAHLAYDCFICTQSPVVL